MAQDNIQTFIPWGSLHHDRRSFDVVATPVPYQWDTRVPASLISECAVYIPLAKVLAYPSKVWFGWPANDRAPCLLEIHIPSRINTSQLVKDVLGIERVVTHHWRAPQESRQRGGRGRGGQSRGGRGRGGQGQELRPSDLDERSIRLEWNEIRYIVIKSPNEVEIGITRPQTGSKLVLMTHNTDQVAQFAQYWLIDRFARTFRLQDGQLALVPTQEVLDLTPFQQPLPLQYYWWRNGPGQEVLHNLKLTLFNLAHSLVQYERSVGWRTDRQTIDRIVESFWAAAGPLSGMELRAGGDPRHYRLFDDPGLLFDEETIDFDQFMEPHIRQVPQVQKRTLPGPTNVSLECQVYVSHYNDWFRVTSLLFVPDSDQTGADQARPNEINRADKAKLDFYALDANGLAQVLLCSFERKYLKFWKEICLMDIGHYAVALHSNHGQYIYVRCPTVQHYSEFCANLFGLIDRFYPEVHVSATDLAETLMLDVYPVTLQAYHQLWTNPGGAHRHHLAYRTMERNRPNQTRISKLIQHDMKLMACKMMNRYAFKLASAFMEQEWDRQTSLVPPFGPEPPRLIHQLRLYDSLYEQMTAWFHSGTCFCEHCHGAPGGRTDDQVAMYSNKLVDDGRIRHASYQEPN